MIQVFFLFGWVACIGHGLWGKFIGQYVIYTVHYFDNNRALAMRDFYRCVTEEELFVIN